MLKQAAIAIIALSAFIALPAFASNCKSEKFVGTFIRVDTTSTDSIGENQPQTSIWQLNLHDDGTADERDAVWLDFPLNTGTDAQYIGNWKCRSDGYLVVTLITAIYNPISAAFIVTNQVPLGSIPTPAPDITLGGYYKTTYLFSVQNADTLNAVKRRTKFYSSNQDPSNPALGVLGSLITTVVVYKRFEASDADLVAP